MDIRNVTARNEHRSMLINYKDVNRISQLFYFKQSKIINNLKKQKLLSI